MKRGSVGKEGASRPFFGVEAALVEEVAKRRLAGKRRLAASDPGRGAEAGGEPGPSLRGSDAGLSAAAHWQLRLESWMNDSSWRPSGEGGIGGVGGEGGAAKIGGEADAVA